MSERPPAPSSAARDALQHYADARRMPADVRARIEASFTPAVRPTVGRTANALWAAVGGLAAALVLWGIVSLQDGRRQSQRDTQAPQEASMQASRTAQQPTTPRKAPSLAPQPPSQLAPVPLTKPRDSTSTPSPQQESRRRAPSLDTPRSPQPDTAAPSIDAQTLAIENRLIAATWSHVRAKQYARARHVLAEHGRRFANGVLAPEREALEVIIGCLSDPDGTRSPADTFMRARPNSVLAKKVRQACIDRSTNE